MKRFFKIPYQSIARDDIRCISRYKHLTDKELTDEIMETIAYEMGKALVNQTWWDTLEIVASYTLGSLDDGREDGSEPTIEDNPLARADDPENQGV